MSDISINNPFDFQFNILEIDDNLPSFKVNINFNIEYISSKFSFLAKDIWFDCLEWENFIKSLEDLENIKEPSNLKDLGEYFYLSIIKEGDFYALELCLNSSKVSTSKSLYKFQKNISKDDLIPLKRSFIEFPMWW